MPDTQYKRRALTHGSPVQTPASIVRGGSPLDRWKFRKALQGADTLIEQSRRVVASQHMGGQAGADGWVVPNTDNDGQGSQTHPDPDDDREIQRYQFALAPGSMLEGRVLYIPSGAVQEFGGSTWDDEGGKGETRWSLTWDNDANSDTSTHVHVQEPSNAQYHAEPQGGLGAWAAIKYGYNQHVVPNANIGNPAEVEKWSEWSTVTAVLNHRGSPRTIHAHLAEMPRAFVSAHDESGEQSAHAWNPDNPSEHPDIYPQTDSDDGATYEEHRFGTHRAIDTARRQADRMGPMLFCWSPYTEGVSQGGSVGNPASVATADYPPDPYTNTTLGLTCLWDTGTTAWSAAAPGFAVAGHYAQRFKECDSMMLHDTGEASIPVRVSVWASQSAGTGQIWLYTNDRSAIGFEVTGASYAWHTFTGHVDAMARPNDTGTINGMLFGRSDGSNTLSVRYAQVEFGEFGQHV